jgi:hypothetical protein
MSAETDRNDRETLRRIAERPGVKRRDAWVVKASTERLILAGLVKPPTSSGKLYLTEAGEAAAKAARS